MNTKKLFVNWFRFYIIGCPLLFCFAVKECFSKRDIYETFVNYLTDCINQREKDLGFFFMIKEGELNILKTSFKMKYLIATKFVYYCLRDLKRDIKDGKI